MTPITKISEQITVLTKSVIPKTCMLIFLLHLCMTDGLPVSGYSVSAYRVQKAKKKLSCQALRNSVVCCILKEIKYIFLQVHYLSYYCIETDFSTSYVRLCSRD